jgi:ketosteroid isomerase-like protein
MHRRTVFSIIAAGVLGTLGRTRAGAQPGTRQLKEVVLDSERGFADSMARRDLARFSSYVSAEAVFFSSPDGSRVLRGRKAVIEGWTRYFDGPKAPFSWAPETAEGLDSGTLAMTTGPVRDQTGRITGRFSSVWRLEPDDHWRVIFDHGCSCA